MAALTRTSVVLALWVSAALAGAHAQVFRSGVDAVTVDVSVMRGTRPVAELQAKDFVLEDNGVRQEITAALDDAPLHLTLLLDTSASVSGDRLDRLIRAATSLLDHLRSGDHTSLITFSHSVRLRTPQPASATELRAALGGIVGTGATSLRDAVQLALSLTADEPGRRLLLVFSDGADTMSWLSDREVLDTARRAASVVHVVRLGDGEFLDRLAATTGGRSWPARSDGELERLFTQALDEMRARYVLTYTQSRSPEKGWHAIKVSLKNRRGVVTARPGYFVPDF